MKHAARHGRIGEGGVARADLEILSAGDGGKQHEQREKRGDEFRNGGSGHWEPPNIGAKVAELEGGCAVRSRAGKGV